MRSSFDHTASFPVYLLSKYSDNQATGTELEPKTGTGTGTGTNNKNKTGTRTNQRD